MLFVGEAAALATAALWGISACMHTAAARLIGSLSLNLFRLPLSLSFFLAGIVLFQSQWNLSHDQVLWLVGSGVIGLAFGDVVFYASAVRIGARLSVLMWELSPAVIAVLAYFFLDESISPMGMVGITLTLVGVVWVLLEKNDGSIPGLTPRRWIEGIVLVLLSVGAQSVSTLLARMALVQGGDVLVSAAVRTGSAVFALWFFVALIGRAGRAVKTMREHPQAMRMTVLAGFIGPTVGVWLSLLAVKHTKAGIAATLIGLEPLVVIALLALYEKKRPSSRLLTGALISFTGTALLFLR
ncbi:MAG: DMT family transporter [Halodesulfovibrio sp.]